MTTSNEGQSFNERDGTGVFIFPAVNGVRLSTCSPVHTSTRAGGIDKVDMSQPSRALAVWPQQR
jgi:hypothetical protein